MLFLTQFVQILVGLDSLCLVIRMFFFSSCRGGVFHVGLYLLLAGRRAGAGHRALLAPAVYSSAFNLKSSICQTGIWGRGWHVLNPPNIESSVLFCIRHGLYCVLSNGET